jgi:hypothetical protein
MNLDEFSSIAIVYNKGIIPDKDSSIENRQKRIHIRFNRVLKRRLFKRNGCHTFIVKSASVKLVDFKLEISKQDCQHMQTGI